MIKIYQINRERDLNGAMFAPYGMTPFDVSIYDEVWSGIGSEDLEDIFYHFNMEHPRNFRGHSLSVSDIVQTSNGYFYCDVFGWKKLDIECM